MLRKTIKTLSLCLFILLAVTACSGNKSGTEVEQPNDQSPNVNQPDSETSELDLEPEEEVTLRLYAGQNLSDEDWDRLLLNPLKEKYPHISIEFLVPSQGMWIRQYIAAGQIPDLITTWNGEAGNYIQVDLLEDLTPLVEKHRMDLERFDPVVLDAIKVMSDKGELLGLPYFLQSNALYYNKAIFDDFGVGYPQDGMTWDEVVALGKDMTRHVDGVQFRGFDPESITRLAFPRSLGIVNADTNEAEVNNDDWKALFQLSNQIYSIPGNMPSHRRFLINGWQNKNTFIQDRTLAMYATTNIIGDLVVAGEDGFDWDLAQYPSFNDNPDVYGMVDAHMISVAKTSKHKDAAFKVVEVFTSDEVQRISVRERPAISPLAGAEFKEEFGKDIPALQDKNIAGMFKSSPAPSPRLSFYYQDARAILVQRHADFILGQIDLNTALRQAEEEINMKIKELAELE